MRIHPRWALALVIVATVPAALTGCASASSSGSRAVLYDSIDALAADSSAIVVGTVSEQQTDGDTTISSIEVENAPTNPQLGANVEDETETVVAVGDVVVVRQDSAPMLTPGDQYMLFLTPSMLEGDAASQYFITGAEAGLYVRDGEEFRRVVGDSGDELPETISVTGDE